MRVKTFPLGRVLATPGAMRALAESGQTAGSFVSRHVGGNWGCVGDEDRRLNDEAVLTGDRILSSYRTDRGVKIWVITEADRTLTTILLPEEY